MSDLYLKWCLIYLDDIVVFSSTVEEHLLRLEAIFQRLGDAGLKLKPSKCHLLQRRIKYIGHVVSENGIETDPDKTLFSCLGLFQNQYLMCDVFLDWWDTIGCFWPDLHP